MIANQRKIRDFWIRRVQDFQEIQDCNLDSSSYLLEIRPEFVIMFKNEREEWKREGEDLRRRENIGIAELLMREE